MTTRRLNSTPCSSGRSDNLEKQSLASPVLQSAIKVDWLERLLLLCESAGAADPLGLIWEQMEAHHHRLTKEGEILHSKEENMAELAVQFESFRAFKLPLLRQLNIL